MAQGSFEAFAPLHQYLWDGRLVLGGTSGVITYSWVLCDQGQAAQNVDFLPTTADFILTTGITAVPQPVTLTYVPVGDPTTSAYVDCSNPLLGSRVFFWDRDEGGGSTEIRTALLVVTASNYAPMLDVVIGSIDLTTDSGVTPISLKKGDIELRMSFNGLWRLQP